MQGEFSRLHNSLIFKVSFFWYSPGVFRVWVLFFLPVLLGYGSGLSSSVRGPRQREVVPALLRPRRLFLTSSPPRASSAPRVSPAPLTTGSF